MFNIETDVAGGDRTLADISETLEEEPVQTACEAKDESKGYNNASSDELTQTPTFHETCNAASSAAANADDDNTEVKDTDNTVRTRRSKSDQILSAKGSKDIRDSDEDDDNDKDDITDMMKAAEDYSDGDEDDDGGDQVGTVLLKISYVLLYCCMDLIMLLSMLRVIRTSNFCQVTSGIYYAPAPQVGVIKRWCASDVCLSVCCVHRA